MPGGRRTCHGPHKRAKRTRDEEEYTAWREHAVYMHSTGSDMLLDIARITETMRVAVVPIQNSHVPSSQAPACSPALPLTSHLTVTTAMRLTDEHFAITAVGVADRQL